jgi:DNA repair protein RecN (Recombination protein N)
MLRFLRIRRLAVIDAVEVEFAPGLNVLTGETGAGKSILVEAVGLLVGGRASGDLVRTGENVATIEAVFEVEGRELVVRREISTQGRSRAFVDDELVTAGALKDRTAGLIELHGQHEHHALLDASSHLRVLDGFADADTLPARVEAAFQDWRSAADALVGARRLEATRGDRLELAAFQLAELERADLKPGEDEDLGQLRQVLASAGRIRDLCEAGYTALYEDDGSVLGRLGTVWRQVAELARIDPAFATYLEARDSIKAQLEDLALFLRQYTRIDASPARLQQVEDRLALVERLKRKYGPDLVAAIARREALGREVTELRQGTDRLIELEGAEAAARETYLSAARLLSAARREMAPRVASRLERQLAELAMEHARFDVRFAGDPSDASRWTAAGIDEAEFFVSPNPGEELRPLVRVASGGELSRIMLAIKTLAIGARAVDGPSAAPAPALVFDEVDAGIGGRVADVVGQKLRALGAGTQVLCITHLPQIAAHADAHFHVAKEVVEGRTVVRVHRLSPAARIEEIGRMLGGVPVTPALRESAAEMLGTRERRVGGESESESKSKGERPPRQRPVRTAQESRRSR